MDEDSFYVANKSGLQVACSFALLQVSFLQVEISAQPLLYIFFLFFFLLCTDVDFKRPWSNAHNLLSHMNGIKIH